MKKINFLFLVQFVIFSMTISKANIIMDIEDNSPTPLPSPSLVTATTNLFGLVGITWQYSGPSNVEFDVYRATSIGGPYKYMETTSATYVYDFHATPTVNPAQNVSASSTYFNEILISWSDPIITPKSYYYKVQTVEKTTREKSAYSEIVSGLMQDIINPQSAMIFVSDDPLGPYTLLAEDQPSPTSGTSTYLHTGLNSGVTKYYRIIVWLQYNESPSNYSSVFEGTTVNPTISAPELICYSGHTVTLQNPPPSTTITWGGTNVAYPSGSTGTSVTVRAASTSTSGSGTITASFSIGGTPYTISKSVSVGPPPVSYITDPIGSYNPVQFYAVPSPNYSTTDYYTWIVSPDAYIYSWMDHAEITFPEPTNYFIGVQATNTCGTSNMVYKYFMYEGDYLMSPNPASTEVEITISAGQEEGMKSASLSSDDEYTVTVLDNYGVAKIQKKYFGKKFTVPVSSLKDGNYFVKISNGKMNVTKQLIIKR